MITIIQMFGNDDNDVEDAITTLGSIPRSLVCQKKWVQRRANRKTAMKRLSW